MNLEPQSWTWMRECIFPSDMGTAHSLINEVIEVMRTELWNEKDLFALELALEETLANAVEHGNDSDPAKMIRFDCKSSQDSVYVRVEDEGAGFDHHKLADPRKPENQMIETGRGVLLIKYFTTRVQWNERGNIIEFEKKRSVK